MAANVPAWQIARAIIFKEASRTRLFPVASMRRERPKEFCGILLDLTLDLIPREFR